jgi:outer membrane protein assembly factor BamA
MTRSFILILAFLLPLSLQALETKGVSAERLKGLRREFPAAFGTNASLGILDEAIKRLYKTGDFETVQLNQNADGEYSIVGIPIRRVKHIRIEGNDYLSQGELLALLDVPEDSQFDRGRVAEGAERIKSRYSEQGFLNAKIEAEFKEDDTSAITVTVRINEGKPCRLQEINFITNNDELKKELKKAMRSYQNRPIEKDTITNISQDIKNYFLSNRYLIATLGQPEIAFNAEKTSGVLTLAIERPFRFILFTEGNQFFTSMEILRKIAVSSENPTGANPAAELAGRIKALYLEKGYANVQVDFAESVYATEFNRMVTFNINEGARVRIKQIEIDGSISKLKDWYLDFLNDHSQSVKTYGYYNRADLDKALEELVFELQNQGFLRARVRSTRVEYSKRRDFVTIQLLLEEGPQTIIRDVIFKGNTQFSTKQLLDAVELEPKSPLSLQRVEESVRKLEDYYTSLGYLDMKVSNPLTELVTYSDDNLNAVVTFEIVEGPKVTVSSIVVEGNEKTADYVVLKELEFEKGETLTPQKISDSIGRLQ